MSNNMGVVCEFELYYFEFWKSAKEYTHLHFSAPIYYHKYASDKNAYETTFALRQIWNGESATRFLIFLFLALLDLNHIYIHMCPEFVFAE